MENIRTQGITRPIALVTGATGSLGPSLVAHLLAEGYSVRAFSRNPLYSEHLHPAAQFIPGSITDAAALDRVLEGVQFVFHLAALLHVINSAAESAAEYNHANVEGTRLVAERAARAGVRRMIYFSTVKVYGTRQRQPITETHPTMPTTLYARSKLGGERAAKTIPAVETVILRLSPVYGPRLKGSWARLINAVARDRFVPIGSLRNVHSLTHVDDVAQAALLVATQPTACGQTFNLVGHESPTLHEILSAIYAACGKRLPELRVPSALALSGAFVLENGLGLLGKRSPFPVESVRQLIEDESYSGAALRTLGFQSSVKLEAGWPAGNDDA